MGTVASAPADFSVFRTLSGSTATLERAATLGEGLAISQWSRSARETLGYDMPGHHTLSLYLRGGEKSFRVGLDSLHGGAGKFCVLPAEHYSRWSMNDNVRFLHLYIAPERLAREAVMRLDCEPRSLELRDRTYIHDDSLTDVCRSLLGADWGRPDQRLAASSAAETVLHQLLHQGVSRKTPQPARGGLAPPCAGASWTTWTRTWTPRSRWLSWLAWRRCPPITSHACSIPPSANRRTPGVRARRIERAKALLAAGKRPGRHRAGQRLRQRQPSVAGLPRRGRRHAGPVSRRPRRTLSRRASPYNGAPPAAAPRRCGNLVRTCPCPWTTPPAARCASTGSPRSSACAKPIGARSKTPRPCAPRAAEGGLPDRILVRAHRLADREQLPAQLQGWTRSALAVLAALFALALFSGIGLALGALGDGARPVNVLWALGALLGLHALTFLLWLASFLLRPAAATGLGRLWLWVTRKLARGPDTALAPQALLNLLARAGCCAGCSARSATCSG